MSKTMKIAFPNGGIIPAEVAKKDRHISVAAHEPVTVPAAYGDSLIADRFAYAVTKDMPLRRESEPLKEATADLDAATAALERANKVLLDTVDPHARAAAENALTDVRQRLVNAIQAVSSLRGA